jgi:hypothetical protein
MNTEALTSVAAAIPQAVGRRLRVPPDRVRMNWRQDGRENIGVLTSLSVHRGSLFGVDCSPSACFGFGDFGDEEWTDRGLRGWATWGTYRQIILPLRKARGAIIIALQVTLTIMSTEPSFEGSVAATPFLGALLNLILRRGHGVSTGPIRVG